MMMHTSAKPMASAIWSIVMFAIVVWWGWTTTNGLGLRPQSPDVGETHLLAFLLLVVLTFPSGLLWAGLLNFMAYVGSAAGFLVEVPEIMFVIVAWLGFVAVGYFQWFRLVPWLWHKWQAKRRRVTTLNI